MSVSISMPGYVLLAMLIFSNHQKQFKTLSVLSDILLEVTPESLRLVATDTHILGILQLSDANSFHVEFECDEPTGLILPVHALYPLLEENHSAVLHLAIHDTYVDANNSVHNLSVVGREYSEFPSYHRIIPSKPLKSLTGFSIDASLVLRFAEFAKALGVEPQFSFSFHEESENISVTSNHIPTFYGLIAPLSKDFPFKFPTWLTVTTFAPPRFVHLRTMDGFSGIDTADNTWTMFTLDESVEQRPGPCAFCGQILVTGWLCLDTGVAVCNRHVTIPSVESSTKFASSRYQRNESLPVEPFAV